MQSIEDEESLSQRFTYQKKVTGLLILTVTCTYPRSAVSFFFFNSSWRHLCQQRVNSTKNVYYFYRKKKIYPKQRVKKAGIHFTKRVYKLSTSEREFLKKLILFRLLSPSPIFQSRNAHLYSFVLKGMCQHIYLSQGSEHLSMYVIPLLSVRQIKY